MLFLDFFVLHSTLFIAITHFLLLFQIVKLIGSKEPKGLPANFSVFLFPDPRGLHVVCGCLARDYSLGFDSNSVGRAFLEPNGL